MSVAFNDEDVRAYWQEFIESHVASMPERYFNDSEIIKAHYPRSKSMWVFFGDLDKYHTEFATYVMEKPSRCLEIGNDVLREFCKPHDKLTLDDKWKPKIRIYGLQEVVSIRNIRNEQIGNLIAIEGLVKRASEIRPRMTQAMFHCPTCSINFLVDQPDDEEVFVRARECDPQQQGCGLNEKRALSPFKWIREESIYTDLQILELQENPEGLRGGAVAEKMTCVVSGDLCEDDSRILPGDRMILTGILKTVATKANGLSFDFRFEVLATEFLQHEYDDIEITDEEEKQIREESQAPNLLDRLAKAVAPFIRGYDMEKKAITLMLLGGQSHELDDGNRIRGDIHILLIGDPGIAKTAICRTVIRLSPRGVYAQGGASTACGLTATVVRDEQTGRYSLDAGALVLGDKGLVAIDELDKMDITDAEAMNEALEQQTVTITKAGLNTTMQARCSVLAAANPKYGRFDEHETIADQVNLTPALLSRFDLIFALKDIPGKDRDTIIATAIADRRLGKVQEKTFSPEFIRKYIAFCRSKVQAIDYSQEARDLIDKFYVGIRASQSGTIPITARQLEGMWRLAEASAKLHIRDVVLEEDAKNAIDITEYYLHKMANDDGKIDIDKATNIETTKTRKGIDAILHFIRLENEGRGVSEGQIKGAFGETMLEEDVEKCLGRLKLKGEIYETASKYLRSIS